MGRQSSGCRTCVGRRVRCDETRPQCKRCLKLGQECPGYRDLHDSVFVNETEHIRQRYSGTMTSREHTVTPTKQLDLSAFAGTMYQTFLLNRFVSTGGQYSDYMTNAVWMNTALSDPEKYPLAAQSLSALSESFYGRQHYQKEIIISSIRSYSHIIRQLRQTLEDTERCKSSDTLGAIAALFYFECLGFTNSRAWMQHAEALSSLMEAKGWEAFQSRPEHSILQSTREPLICAALVARKRTFLEDEKWKLRDRDLLGRHISDLDQIYAQIPRIAESILLLEEEPRSVPSDSRFLNSILQEITDIQLSLSAWSSSWTEHYERSLKRVSSTKFILHISDLQDDLGEVFEFDDLKIAKVWVTYWMVSILVFFQTRKLDLLSLNQSTDYPSLKGKFDASAPVINICRSIPYFLQPMHIEAASLYLSVPIRVAYLAVSPSSAEAGWLISWRDYLIKRTGVEILRNVTDNIPMRRAQPRQET